MNARPQGRRCGWLRRLATLLTLTCVGSAAVPLEDGWANPPTEARLRAYWWWLNGNVTEPSITRDLEAMKAKGFGGALICDAGGADQDGNDRVPHGPTFFSPEWRTLYKHALREAGRLGLEMSLNIQSGWNLGGPMVTPDDAPKKLVWTERVVRGPTPFAEPLAEPKSRDGYYRDLFVLAYPIQPGAEPSTAAPETGSGLSAAGLSRRPIQNWEQKALLKPLVPFSAPDSTPLFQEWPEVSGEEDFRATEVLDLTAKLGRDGALRWDVPDGAWAILRLGCTLNDHCRVSTCSDGWQGYALDPFDAGAFRRYWDAVVEPLIADAGPIAGRALKYLHTDSWEVEVANWTPTLREEFRQRRGYDLLPWLPVVAGRIVNRRSESDRFLHDFRRTMGDLAIANHYQPFRDGAHRHGLQIHPESGGPHAVPIDAQQCLGFSDAPMSEFWAWSWRHRIGDPNRFFVKQPASAAHTYGRKLVLAEGFTTIGPHWQETLWDNLKPAFDKAGCEGLNLLVWHAFVCSPEEMGLPGQQYFAGTHLNPNVTWWPKSAPFFAYLNRCQFMLQQGLPVADVAWYYGSHVPNFARLKQSDPARVLPGYDYDILTAEALLTRTTVQNGRLTLPDGMSYRLLVLPDRTMISLPVLEKLRALVAAGLTVLGPKPAVAESLQDYPQCDAAMAKLACELWGEGTDRSAAAGAHAFGQGRVLWGTPAREVLLADGVQPDCAFRDTRPDAMLDYFHRRDGMTDIYFVANRSNRVESAVCAFRVSARAPELWDPVTGERRYARAYTEAGGGTAVPLEFPPCGSFFVVFRAPSSAHPATAASNHASGTPILELAGPWTAHFPIGSSAAERNDREMLLSSTRAVVFDPLGSWTDRSEPGIKFYSGAATYLRTFELPADGRSGRPATRFFLDLGRVRELAEVSVNGRSLGIVWAPPFRVDITDAVKPGPNQLSVEVVNFWPNRIIGDAALPPEKRFTRTNIRKLTRETPLMESGLLGPVRILAEERAERGAAEPEAQ